MANSVTKIAQLRRATAASLYLHCKVPRRIQQLFERFRPPRRRRERLGEHCSNSGGFPATAAPRDACTMLAATPDAAEGPAAECVLRRSIAVREDRGYRRDGRAVAAVGLRADSCAEPVCPHHSVGSPGVARRSGAARAPRGPIDPGEGRAERSEFRVAAVDAADRGAALEPVQPASCDSAMHPRVNVWPRAGKRSRLRGHGDDSHPGTGKRSHGCEQRVVSVVLQWC
jgi:hypothetical protein